LPIGTYAASANFHQPRDTTAGRIGLCLYVNILLL
jgi:hypothetical protein